MNDSDTKEEKETDDAIQQERSSAIKTTIGVVRECLVKIGIPPLWGALISAILGAGMAILISLSSTGCHGLMNWSMKGEKGQFSIKGDPVLGSISIEGKRNFTVDEEK